MENSAKRATTEPGYQGLCLTEGRVRNVGASGDSGWRPIAGAHELLDEHTHRAQVVHLHRSLPWRLDDLGGRLGGQVIIPHAAEWRGLRARGC